MSEGPFLGRPDRIQWLVIIIAAFVVISFAIIPPAHAIAYESDYTLSTALYAGIYVQYNVLGHPYVQSMRMTILGTPANSSSLVFVNVTLYKADRSSISRLQLITVKGGSDDAITLPVRINGSVIFLSSSDRISIPDQVFTVRFPIISPHLVVNDFITLDERKLLQQNAVGFFVGATAGDVWNYTFRHELADTIQNQQFTASWTWDAETGLLTKFSSSNTLPLVMTLSSTNAWSMPLGSIYKPVGLVIFAWDVYMLGMMVFGAFFSLWQLWAIVIGVVLLHVLHGWLKNYAANRSALRNKPQLRSLLNKAESQEKKVMYLHED